MPRSRNTQRHRSSHTILLRLQTRGRNHGTAIDAGPACVALNAVWYQSLPCSSANRSIIFTAKSFED